MKTYTYIPTADVFRAKSKKSIATYLKNNTRGFENDTMKDFMKGYSDRSALLGRSIRFDKEENFIEDLFKSGDIIEGNAVEKFRSAFERKKKAKEFDEKSEQRDAEMSRKIPTKKQIDYRLNAMIRREKGRNEGRFPRTYSSSLKKSPISGMRTTYFHVFKEGGKNKYLMSVHKSMDLGGTLIDKRMFDHLSKQVDAKIIRHKKG